MSQQPEPDPMTGPEQATVETDGGSQPQENTAIPVISIDVGRSTTTRSRRVQSARHPRKPASGFDAASLARLVEAEPESQAQSEPEPPGADPEATVVREAESVRDSSEPTDVKDETVVDPDRPVVRVGPAATISPAKHATKSRLGKQRSTSRHKTNRGNRTLRAWIMLGAYGGVAVAVVFLFVHLLNEQSRKDATVGPEQPKVATDTGLPQWSPTTASPGQAAPSQPAPVQPKSASSRPSPYSPSGVRQMTPEEKARRKNRINSFAEMGRAAEAELRNDDSQTPTN